MKTCSNCFASVQPQSIFCPSCGQPYTQSKPAAPNQAKLSGTRKSIKFRRPLGLYAMLGVTVLFLAAVLLTNGFRSWGVADDSNLISQSTSVTPSPDPQPSVEVPSAPQQSASKYPLASQILERLTQAGLCKSGEFSGNAIETNNFHADLFRTCFIQSQIGAGDKFVSIYTGPDLSNLYSQVSNLSTFQVAIYGDGWTIVTNYYPSENRSYLDDSDIRSIANFMGGQTVVRNY